MAGRGVQSLSIVKPGINKTRAVLLLLKDVLNINLNHEDIMIYRCTSTSKKTTDWKPSSLSTSHFCDFFWIIRAKNSNGLVI